MGPHELVAQEMCEGTCRGIVWFQFRMEGSAGQYVDSDIIGFAGICSAQDVGIARRVPIRLMWCNISDAKHSDIQ